MKSKLYLFIIFILSIFVIFANLQACQGDDDEDIDNNDDDDGDDDDDNDHDDGDDDDDDDDDEVNPDAPVLINAHFEKVYDPYPDHIIGLNLMVEICDSNNDLEGGRLHIHVDPFDYLIEFSSFTIPIVPSDCENNLLTLPVYFSLEDWDESNPMEVCVDSIFATDGAGNSAIPLFDICISLP